MSKKKQSEKTGYALIGFKQKGGSRLTAVEKIAPRKLGGKTFTWRDRKTGGLLTEDNVAGFSTDF